MEYIILYSNESVYMTKSGVFLRDKLLYFIIILLIVFIKLTVLLIVLEIVLIICIQNYS